MASNFAEIECSKCRNVITIDYSDLDVQESGGEERQMGTEITYYGVLDIRCPNCRNSMVVEYTETEYPIGVPNFDETTARGGSVIAGFGETDVYWKDRLYELDQQTGIYTPQQQQIITRVGKSASDLILAANKNPEILYDTDPRDFEEMVAYIFSKHGFEVEVTKQTRDGGRDIIAFKTDELGTPLKYLIECKRYAKHRPIAVDIVRALYGVHQAEGANKSMVVTTSTFSQDAQNFTRTKNTTEIQMRLVDFTELKNWIRNTSSRI